MGMARRKEPRGKRAAPGAASCGRVIGKHSFGNLYGLDPTLLKDKRLLEGIISEAIKRARMHLVELRSWDFGGSKGGVSVMALITESHVVLHTWKKYNYASLDIYTCGGASDPEKAFDYVLSRLRPRKHQRFFADRSSRME
jgi:S-adenosylmethionine decarboxylase